MNTIQEEIIKSIDVMVQKRMDENKSFDVATVIEEIKDNKYKVRINGTYHWVTKGVYLNLSIGRRIWVRVPDGDLSKAYIFAQADNKEIHGSGLELGETSTTAYRGDRGKIAYDHSLEKGNPHGTTMNDLGFNCLGYVEGNDVIEINNSEENNIIDIKIYGESKFENDSLLTFNGTLINTDNNGNTIQTIDGLPILYGIPF